MRHHALPRPLVALSLLFAINSFVCWIIAGLASISALPALRNSLRGRKFAAIAGKSESDPNSDIAGFAGSDRTIVVLRATATRAIRSVTPLTNDRRVFQYHHFKCRGPRDRIACFGFAGCQRDAIRARDAAANLDMRSVFPSHLQFGPKTKGRFVALPHGVPTPTKCSWW